MPWFQTSEERRLRLRELEEQRNYTTLAVFVVILCLAMMVFSYIAVLLAIGCLFFPAIFAAWYWRKLPAPRRYPLKVVALVTGIELALLIVLSPLYPSYSLGLPFMATVIPCSLAMWMGLGNAIAGRFLIKRQSRQLKAAATDPQLSPSLRYSPTPYTVAVSICLVLGVILSAFAQKESLLSLVFSR